MRLAVEQHRPFVRLVHAEDDVAERRLAGAVLAEQALDLAGPEVEVDIVQSGEVAEPLGDARHFEQGAVPPPMTAEARCS